MTRQLVPMAMAAALLLAGCNRGEDANATASETAETVVTVGPENVAIANLAELRSGPTISGSLEPEQLATVRSEVIGSVLRTFVEAGERVRRGQLLANLDDRAIEEGVLSSRSAVRSAESALSLARRNLQRTERLTQAGALPERDLENARLDVTNAEGALADARARLAAAQEQLEDTRVRAPFDGIVSERQADAGDVVQLGAALFSIVDPRHSGWKPLFRRRTSGGFGRAPRWSSASPGWIGGSPDASTGSTRWWTRPRARSGST